MEHDYGNRLRVEYQIYGPSNVHVSIVVRAVNVPITIIVVYIISAFFWGEGKICFFYNKKGSPPKHIFPRCEKWGRQSIFSPSPNEAGEKSFGKRCRKAKREKQKQKMRFALKSVGPVAMTMYDESKGISEIIILLRRSVSVIFAARAYNSITILCERQNIIIIRVRV